VTTPIPLATTPPPPPTYGLVEALRNLLDIPSTDTASDVDLQRALDAASAWITWFTGRSFGLTATGVVRTYEATDADSVEVVDLVSTAPTILVDTNNDRTYATTLVPGQYELRPPSGAPFQEVRAWPTPPAGITPIVFSPGQLVQITGQWGYVDSRSRLPAAVNQACHLLAARWFTRKEAPFSVVQNAALGAYQRVPETDPDVVALLVPLSRDGSPGQLVAVAQLPALAPGGWVMV
jgi:hypothetical protein